MNLHEVVRGAINVVNDEELVDVKVSTGQTKNADFTQTPTYAEYPNCRAQVQPLGTKDLELVDQLNLQGTMMAFYFSGTVAGIVRAKGKGGDLITRQKDGSVWLVTQVPEQWADWCHVIGTLQNGG